MRSWSSLLAASILTFAQPAFAAKIIDVSGPISAGSPSFSDGGGALAQLTVGSDLTDVKIDASVICLQCEGFVFLLNDFGPSVTVSNVKGFSDFSSVVNPLLSLASLDAGTYYLLIGSVRGGFVWNSTQSPTFKVAPGAGVGPSFATIAFDAGVPFNSQFDAQFDESLIFSVQGNFASAVPEPDTWFMMLIGFGLIGATLRQRGTALRARV